MWLMGSGSSAEGDEGCSEAAALATEVVGLCIGAGSKSSADHQAALIVDEPTQRCESQPSRSPGLTAT